MKKVTLLATTLLVAIFLVACSESSTTTNEAPKTSSTSQLKNQKELLKFSLRKISVILQSESMS